MRKSRTKGVNSPQQVLLEILIEEPMGVMDLVERTGFSASFIRSNITILEASQRISRVDNRMPYLYHVPENSPIKIHKERIKTAKLALWNEIPTENDVINMIKQAPRSQWPTIAGELRAIAEAIDMLDGEGRLIDTLEGML